MSDQTVIENKKKFSLIELLMIIMIVGIVFTLIIPLHNDRITRDKLQEAIRNIQIITRANEEFKNDPERGAGFYMFEHTVVKYNEPIRDEMGNLIPANISGDDLLNIRSKLEKKNDFFYFDYFVTDTTIVARTNKYFGKDGAEVFYYLPSGPWGVGKDNVSQNIIDPNWLP